jgi:hypothetical protein
MAGDPLSENTFFAGRGFAAILRQDSIKKSAFQVSALKKCFVVVFLI